MLPKLIKDMIASVDGIGYVGKVTIDSLPKLARSMEDYQAGGMAGAVKIDQGQEPLELEITFHEYASDIIKTFATCTHDGVAFRFNGSCESDSGSCEHDAVEIIARGRFSELDFGGYKPKENTEMKCKAELSYYKYSINGEDLVEVDMVNYILKVGGKDKLAERRRALKL